MRACSSTREDINVGINCYDILFDKIAEVNEGGGVIVVGDMNARTSELQECVIDGIHGINTANVMNDPASIFETENVNTITVNDLVANDIAFKRVNEDKKQLIMGIALSIYV